MTIIVDSLAEDILDLVATLTNVYVSMHTADPGKTGADEATGVDRVVIAAADWSAYAADATTGGRKTDNAQLLDFGDSTAAETYTHGGIWDAATDGNFIMGGELTTPVTVAIGSGLTIPVGDLVLAAAGFSSS